MAEDIELTQSDNLQILTAVKKTIADGDTDMIQVRPSESYNIYIHDGGTLQIQTVGYYGYYG